MRLEMTKKTTLKKISICLNSEINIKNRDLPSRQALSPQCHLLAMLAL